MNTEGSLKLVATTYAGLESLLASELVDLGAADVSIGRRMVSFSGDKALLYRANYRSR
ncbi:MAG: RNA methyltransferase, partial [Bacteroidales bacterium]|nr:RNA methyltransferase [Bacteroidales bacterium]